MRYVAANHAMLEGSKEKRDRRQRSYFFSNLVVEVNFDEFTETAGIVVASCFR